MDSNQPQQILQLALAHHQAGRLQQAEVLYRQILQIAPNHPDALHLLGVIARQQGRPEIAIELIRRAIAHAPQSPIFHNNLGNACKDQGKLAEAIECYRKALTIQPNYPDALNNLGLALHAIDQSDEAMDCFRNTLKCNPDHAEAWLNSGNILQEQNRLDEAIGYYRKAIEIQPDYVEAYNNLGIVLQLRGNCDEAIACSLKTLSLRPNYADAYANLGNALQELGRLPEAVAHYHRALEIKPDNAQTLNNLANVLYEQGHWQEAIRCYDKALHIDPEYADAYSNLGTVYHSQNMLDEAARNYRQALSLRPNYTGACYNLANVLKDQCDQSGAIEHYRKAIALRPDYAEARWGLAIAQLPVMYGHDDDPEHYREQFRHSLIELEQWFDNEHLELGHDAVGVAQPFHLAFVEDSHRDLLARYGALCVRLMQKWQEAHPFTRNEPAHTDRIRIGIVSAHIHEHSVWFAIVKAWFRHLDRNRFELHAFYTGSKYDRETSWAMSQSSSFHHGGRRFPEWVQTILSQNPDVLIYPEIGMDPTTTKLASLRIAPVQVGTWGHPETTGLPTIDYYLSAEDLESPEAQQNYTEELVSLPHLGCCYQPFNTQIVVPDFPALNIREDRPLFICPGAPFKYMPRYDRVIVDIARRVGKCQFIFFSYIRHAQSDKLRDRLAKAFESSGMDFNEYIAFIPWQNRPEFYGLMQRAHVFLDTIGFSGFNTAMQAIECGLPIVTIEGRFLRGRLASGILRRMGLPELVVPDTDHYIAQATKLAQDGQYRTAIRQRIEKNCAMLYEDVAPIRAMEQLLETVTKSLPS